MHILADCDGVLLDWEEGFHQWTRERGFNLIKVDTYAMHDRYSNMVAKQADSLIKEFNKSAWMMYLQPYKDAVEGVKMLAEAGHTITVLTAMGGDKYSRLLREWNLDIVFGEVIKEVVFTPETEDKTKALSNYKYSGLWWIEDKPSNHKTGLDMGLRSILIDHPHNRDYEVEHRLKSWKDIANLICKSKT